MDIDDKIKRHYEYLCESYYLKMYRAHLRHEKFDNSEPLLGKSSIDVSFDEDALQKTPNAIRAAKDYYCGVECYYTRMYKVSYIDVTTYAIVVSTDGSDGWIEVYDEQGREIGIGRTWMELIGWGNIDEIRNESFRNNGIPNFIINSDKTTLWQFVGSSSLWEGYTGRYGVILESFPDNKEDDIINILYDATGIKEFAIAIVLDCLPICVTRLIPRECAEAISQQLTEIGAVTSIKEY